MESLHPLSMAFPTARSLSSVQEVDLVLTVTKQHVVEVRAGLNGGRPTRELLPLSVGGCTTGEGVWRFFSASHPALGIRQWNDAWCKAWRLDPGNVFAFGEDLFGNQLILPAGRPNVHLCNHENGECFDLDLNIADLLEAAVEHGLAWIDFYADGSLGVAAGTRDRASWEQHLHWTQPLVLGGPVTTANITVVDRLAHLTGHAKLWAQLGGLPPGAEVIV